MYSKMIRAGLVAALMLFGCAAASHAQQQPTITPEKRALLKELFDVTGLTANVNAMMDVIISQNEKDLPNILAQTASRDKSLTPEERATLEQKIRESAVRANVKLREAFQRLNYVQALEDVSSLIFDKHFTEAELKDWIAFYRSPVGKKTVELMPVMMSETVTELSRSFSPRLTEELNKIIEEETKQLEKEVGKPAPAPQSPTKIN